MRAINISVNLALSKYITEQAEHNCRSARAQVVFMLMEYMRNNPAPSSTKVVQKPTTAPSKPVAPSGDLDLSALDGFEFGDDDGA